MSGFKGTPGPWVVCGTPPNPCWREGLTIGAASQSDARRVCDVWDWGSYNPMTEANARLIAAAPELLEALEGLVHWYAKRETASMTVSGGEGLLPIEHQDKEVQTAMRAIAKATQP